MREFIVIGNESYVYGEIGGRYYLGIDNYFTRVLVETDTLEEILEYVELLKEKERIKSLEKKLNVERNLNIKYLGTIVL